ncbi:MAG: hypothetical protein HOW97_08105 [Catenulispora sp.]|nr:hypothetical protein [Catenulispora sp.]
MTRRLSAAAARAVIEAAERVKAPTWPEDNRWHVVSGGQVLVVIEPAYSGGRRAGWRYWLADVGPGGNNRSWDTIDQAAAAGLGAWERWATRPNRNR